MNDPFLRSAEVRRMIGHEQPIARSTLWRWIREGRFPPPTKLSPKLNAWPQSTVERWLREQRGEAA